MNDTPTFPKSLRDPAAVRSRLAMLKEPHIEPLTRLVDELRGELGVEYRIPYFDPLDGGTNASLLFLMEAPGPKAQHFISRDNPDESARNIFELTRDAGIDRRECVNWNVVPWYCAKPETGTNRNPRDAEVDAALPHLQRLLALLPVLRAVVLVGRKAERAYDCVRLLRPDLKVHITPHPSPMIINRLPGNRQVLLDGFRRVREASTRKA